MIILKVFILGLVSAKSLDHCCVKAFILNNEVQMFKGFDSRICVSQICVHSRISVKPVYGLSLCGAVNNSRS